MANDALDLGQLRTFVAIADHGGFGRAATALHLSQPAVSQHVRLLEKRLRRTLVEKDGRRTRFTAAGEDLLMEARRIISAHDEALARLDLTTRPPVVIGSTETAAEQVLPRLLTTLRDAYPGRGAQFHIDRSTQMTEAVLKGTIDLAVLLGFPGDTHGRLVGTLPLRWYSAPARPLPHRDQPLALVAYREPCGMRQRALHRLAEAGHRVEVAAESTTLEGVIAAARAGLGVAILPSTGVTPHGLVRRHDLPDLGEIGVHLATRRDLDADVTAVALGALEEFFESAPVSRLAG
ncbi:LysR family transcriptional regulator [Umezawaea sp. NPDC059074]|uniref:LysR family transcriptional regulator n=1 Tax=Umezawaea sp. NPDC059074 TaxID=3346716 RepID=UPI0036A6A3CA